MRITLRMQRNTPGNPFRLAITLSAVAICVLSLGLLDLYASLVLSENLGRQPELLPTSSA